MEDQSHSTEEEIISESSEISIGENPNWVGLLANSFPAFESRNYKLYFSGQLISLIGTWLQIVAQGWLVLKMTNSAFLIGLIAALGALPSFMFTLFGGVIVDWFPKRRILLFTQSGAMILAFILGVLNVFKVITVWEIGLLSFLLGVVNAIDTPARQAFVPELVSKDQLASAIALNSGVFNTARVLGPGVAGLLIALMGTGGAFILNGISYIAVIVALMMMHMEDRRSEKRTHALTAIKEGFAYSFAHPIIRTLILFTAVSSVFGWSYTTMLPLIAKNEFGLEAAGLGSLYAATGLGSLLATFLIAAFSKKIPPVVFIAGGSMLFAVSIMLFSLTHSIHFALVLLFLSGLGLLSQFVMMNTRIQSLVKSEYRGRVMSIYVFMFLGLTPLGSFEVGWLSEKMGTGFALSTGAIIVFIFAFFVFLRRNKITAAFDEYEKKSETGTRL
jgi:MFS family permease